MSKKSSEFQLEIKNIYKEYPLMGGTTFKTLDDISINVKKGEFVSIIGPSGSGKSTLFNLISGLESPSSGNIFLDGESIKNRKGKVSYMPQKDYLLPWRTVLDNVILGMEIQGYNIAQAKEKAMGYMEIFGLASFENEYPNALSGGMKQRAALLRTMLLNNNVLLLDEPFGALDEITRLQMQNWLLSIWEKFEHTILFVTHSIDEAIYLSDRVIVLTARPASIRQEVQIKLERKRTPSMMTEDKFTKLKRELLLLLE